jgi:hypothetical protein
MSGMQLLETLVGSLRGCLAGFPDKRRGMNTTYDMADIGMAAFSVFFMQSPSFLAHQRQLQEGHGQSNCTSLFGVAKMPSDNHIRDMLDPASPILLHPVFGGVVAQLQQTPAGLDMFRRLDDRVLIALDGTEYHRSQNVHCPHCSTRQRGKSEREYFHSMLTATLVAPGHDKVMPLVPEFITLQDGSEKQDCENMAAKRWLAAHGQRYATLNPVYLGDDLFSRQPLCQAVLDAGGSFIFVCKPSSHPLIQEYLTGIDPQVVQQVVKRGTKRVIHRYRWHRQGRPDHPRPQYRGDAVVRRLGGRLRRRRPPDTEAAAVTVFILAGNTLLRPLVDWINRRPLGAPNTEAQYHLYATCQRTDVADIRDLLDDALSRASYPIRKIEVVSEGAAEVELAADLVPTTADPAELDAVVAELERSLLIRSATWTAGTTA